VLGLDFRGDGQLLATANEDHQAQLWDVGSRQRRAVLSGHSQAVRKAVFSPDGRLLATSSDDHTARLWDVDSQRQRQVLRGHRDKVRGLSFSPDGQLLATASDDHELRIWKVQTGDGRLLGRHPARVYQVDFHPTGNFVGAPCSDGTARIWNIHNRQYTVLRGHQSEANVLAFSPDGKLAATASDDSTVRVWDVAQARPYWRAPVVFGSPPWLLTHQGWLRLDEHSAENDAQLPLSGGPEFLGPEARQALVTQARLAIAAPPVDRPTHLCVHTYDDTVQLWDLPRDRVLLQQQVPELERLYPHPLGCIGVAGRTVRFFRRTGVFDDIDIQTPVTTSTDQRGVAVVAADHLIVVGQSGAVLSRYRGEKGMTAAVRAPPETKQPNVFFLGYRDGTIERIVIDSALQQPRRRASFDDVPASAVLRMLVGPMNTLIVGYANGFVGIWDHHTAKRLDYLRLHGSVVHLLLREARLYAASELGSHLVWDLRVLQQPYCQLMQEVWKRVPVIWQHGRPAASPPPVSHRCWGHAARGVGSADRRATAGSVD